MYCTRCGATNDDNAYKCTTCGEVIQPDAVARTAAAAPGPAIPNYLVQSILVTLFCCMPAGIPAIVYAAQADSKLKTGDVDGALAASRNAKTWCWVSLGVGLAGSVGWLLFAVMGGVMSNL